MSEYLNIASFRFCTEAEGPGKRCAIWVQGCSRRCPGCCNPEMQPFTAKNVVRADDVFELVQNAALSFGIEGVTLLGGEPVLQAAGLSRLAQLCREHGLSVMLFSGFLYEELLEMNDENVNRLLEYTDILVDGEFIENQYEEKRAWAGSQNQRFFFLSDRYAPGIEYETSSRSIELRISDKDIITNGWPFE